MIKNSWKRIFSIGLGILVFLLLIRAIGDSSCYSIEEKSTKAPVGVTPLPTPQYINQELSRLLDNGRPYGIFVSGNYAYMACRTYGLRIIDISTPSNPVEVGRHHDGGEPLDVYVVDSVNCCIQKFQITTETMAAADINYSLIKNHFISPSIKTKQGDIRPTIQDRLEGKQKRENKKGKEKEIK